MANKTKRGHQQVRERQHKRKVSWSSKASVDTTDTEWSEQSGILDMLASGICGCLDFTDYDGDVLLSKRGGRNKDSVDANRQLGCMLPHPPSCLDMGDYLRFGGPPMNNVSIKNRCNSVDGSELTMPRAIERMAHHHYDAYDKELVQSAAVTLEPMNRPTSKGWLSLKKSTKRTCRGDSSAGSRGSKNSRKSAGSRSGSGHVVLTLTPDDRMEQLRRVQLRKTNSKLYEI